SVNRLYRQEKPGGPFRKVEKSGLEVAGWNTGVAVADVNNDGWPDILLTQYGGIKLFLNMHDGHFQDVTEEAGLNKPLLDPSAAFLDSDRDGLLDLVVVNYVDYDPTKKCFAQSGKPDFCGPIHFRGTCSKLFHNLGPAPDAEGKPGARVRFEDVSFESGL